MTQNVLFISDFAILHFHVELKDDEGNVKIKSGLKIVEELKSKLKDTDDIIGLKLIDLDTLICQNDCSGHGYCKQDIRSCVCESFWIENFIRRSLMDGKSNCGKRNSQTNFQDLRSSIISSHQCNAKTY